MVDYWWTEEDEIAPSQANVEHSHTASASTVSPQNLNYHPYQSP
jgi:hypothetical protein